MIATLRDRLAAVLGPGNDDTTAYAQADAVLEELNRWDAERSLMGDSKWDDAVARFFGRDAYTVQARLALELIDDAFCDVYAESAVDRPPSRVGLFKAIDRLQAWRRQHGLTYEPFQEMP